MLVFPRALACLLLVVLHGLFLFRRCFGGGLVFRPVRGQGAFLRQDGRAGKREEGGDEGKVAKGENGAFSRLEQSAGERPERDLVACGARCLRRR